MSEDVPICPECKVEMKERIDWFECPCGIWKLKKRPRPIGEMKPCPFCGGEATIVKMSGSFYNESAP